MERESHKIIKEKKEEMLSGEKDVVGGGKDLMTLLRTLSYLFLPIKGPTHTEPLCRQSNQT
jgi:hypothetical protein